MDMSRAAMDLGVSLNKFINLRSFFSEGVFIKSLDMICLIILNGVN